MEDGTQDTKTSGGSKRIQKIEQCTPRKKKKTGEMYVDDHHLRTHQPDSNDKGQRKFRFLGRLIQTQKKKNPHEISLSNAPSQGPTAATPDQNENETQKKKNPHEMISNAPSQGPRAATPNQNESSLSNAPSQKKNPHEDSLSNGTAETQKKNPHEDSLSNGTAETQKKNPHEDSLSNAPSQGPTAATPNQNETAAPHQNETAAPHQNETEPRASTQPHIVLNAANNETEPRASTQPRIVPNAADNSKYNRAAFEFVVEQFSKVVSRAAEASTKSCHGIAEGSFGQLAQANQSLVEIGTKANNDNAIKQSELLMKYSNMGISDAADKAFNKIVEHIPQLFGDATIQPGEVTIGVGKSLQDPPPTPANSTPSSPSHKRTHSDASHGSQSSNASNGTQSSKTRKQLIAPPAKSHNNPAVARKQPTPLSGLPPRAPGLPPRGPTPISGLPPRALAPSPILASARPASAPPTPVSDFLVSRLRLPYLESTLKLPTASAKGEKTCTMVTVGFETGTGDLAYLNCMIPDDLDRFGDITKVIQMQNHLFCFFKGSSAIVHVAEAHLSSEGACELEIDDGFEEAFQDYHIQHAEAVDINDHESKLLFSTTEGKVYVTDFNPNEGGFKDPIQFFIGLGPIAASTLGPYGVYALPSKELRTSSKKNPMFLQKFGKSEASKMLGELPACRVAAKMVYGGHLLAYDKKQNGKVYQLDDRYPLAVNHFNTGTVHDMTANSHCMFVFYTYGGLHYKANLKKWVAIDYPSLTLEDPNRFIIEQIVGGESYAVCIKKTADNRQGLIVLQPIEDEEGQIGEQHLIQHDELPPQAQVLGLGASRSFFSVVCKVPLSEVSPNTGLDDEVNWDDDPEGPSGDVDVHTVSGKPSETESDEDLGPEEEQVEPEEAKPEVREVELEPEEVEPEDVELGEVKHVQLEEDQPEVQLEPEEFQPEPEVELEPEEFEPEDVQPGEFETEEVKPVKLEEFELEEYEPEDVKGEDESEEVKEVKHVEPEEVKREEVKPEEFEWEDFEPEEVVEPEEFKHEPEEVKSEESEDVEAEMPEAGCKILK